MNEKDGGPAFPTPEMFERSTGDIMAPPSQGMMLRDWFAGQALNGLLANSVVVQANMRQKDFAQESYEMADAMIVERNKCGEVR